MIRSWYDVSDMQFSFALNLWLKANTLERSRKVFGKCEQDKSQSQASNKCTQHFFINFGVQY